MTSSPAHAARDRRPVASTRRASGARDHRRARPSASAPPCRRAARGSAKSGRRASTPASCRISSPKRREPSANRLERRADPGGPAGPPRRDHRADRSQDDHQRAELRREGVHGGLRGLASPDLGQRHRRARSTCAMRCAAIDLVHEPGRQALPAQRADRRADRASARLAPLREALLRGRQAGPGRVRRLRPVPLPQRARAAGARHAARTSTCPSSRAISKRGCGTTCSSTPRRTLGLPAGSIKATVLIETILAAFEMDEILYELRDYIVGLNCGRWDYIFSFIKKFRRRPDFVLPDREQVTMTTHFLRSYSQLLIKTCHRRGAFAMGGMARADSDQERSGGERGGARQGARRQAARSGRRPRRHLGGASRPGADRDARSSTA